jgi:hypothetical protein
MPNYCQNTSSDNNEHFNQKINLDKYKGNHLNLNLLFISILCLYFYMSININFNPSDLLKKNNIKNMFNKVIDSFSLLFFNKN